MPYRRLLFIYSVVLIMTSLSVVAQDILPPVLPWKGKSLQLIASKENQWITPTELSGFRTTPSYQETMDWLKRLCGSNQRFKIVPIGTSGSNRVIYMIIASATGAHDAASLLANGKPTILAQAGIHAGEIDGKDAGMMLLRDLAGKKSSLIDNVNFLFIPILNVDGHERTSPFNRVNQRGPENMGWRTNSRNLNLNRDYGKLDTEEVQAVVRVINSYQPDLYLDLHVTDGADYQYDITYGFGSSYSPAITAWFKKSLTPAVDKALQDNGHIPGPLIFAANDRDFTEGMVEFAYSARFSNGYGDLRHLPTILVENHSLKPFRQRVLGTYVLLEAMLTLLHKDGAGLKAAIEKDKALRKGEVVLRWKAPAQPEEITLKGIESNRIKSALTGTDYVQWTGKPVSQKIPYLRFNQPEVVRPRPKAFWVPSVYKNVIERLRAHGITMDSITTPSTMEVTMHRLTEYTFSKAPVEGHFTVAAKTTTEKRSEVFPPGSVRVPTDQPLGELAMHLLHPESEESFLQWGFFPEIFSRTEYVEEYVVEPLAAQMMEKDATLKSAFEQKKKDDPSFASDKRKVYEWFYQRSPYFDSRWLLYPVGIEE